MTSHEIDIKIVAEKYYKTDPRLIVRKNRTCLHVINNTKLGYLVAKYGDGVVTNQLTGGGLNNTGARGRVQKETIPTIVTSKNCVGIVTKDLRIRYITELESFLLMGYTKLDYENCIKKVSEHQLFKQAGNSIVVQKLEKIIKNLEKEHKMQHIKIFELFAGIGAPRKALTNLGISHECLGFSEIDKYAIKSYCAIHSESASKNYGDITKIKDLPKGTNLLVGGFPCQDISVAGKQNGIIKNKTRSGLMYEMLRLVKKSKPKYVITENVKNILSKKHKPQLDEYIRELSEIGYKSNYEVLNAKDFGIPQNRKRVFIVSILNADKVFDFNKLEKTKCPKLIDFLDLDSEIDKKYDELTTLQQRILNSQIGNTKDYCPNRTYVGNLNGTYNFLSTKKLKDIEEVLGTITCRKDFALIHNDKSIRFINSKEQFRLMGFTDEDYKKAKIFLSDTQLTKRAGNSIVVPILESILKEIV